MIVKTIRTLPGDVVLVPGDIHFDKQDDDALSIMTSVAWAAGVNTLCMVGDTFNSAGISRHPRPTRKFRFRRGTVKAERAAAEPWFDAFSALITRYRSRPGGKYILTGNHEHWWEGVQDEFPGLLDTPWYELYGDLFDGWNVFREYTAAKFGPLLVAHGHRLRGSLAKYSAASVLANYPGQNTLYGHTHRMDSCTLPTYKYGVQVMHGAWTIGHMSDILSGLKEPNLGPHSERHTQGFGVVSFHDAGLEGREDLRFEVEMVPIHRDDVGKAYALFRGKMFRP